jgi:hypothetical protein
MKLEQSGYPCSLQTVANDPIEDLEVDIEKKNVPR